MKLTKLIVSILLFIILVGVLILLIFPKEKEKESEVPIIPAEVLLQTESDESEQEEVGNSTVESSDAQIAEEYHQLKSTDAVENESVQKGIDVSRYQGTIDWSKVAASDVSFAMIRVGLRTADTGEIVEDANARYNLQEASKNGIKIGAYFFSSAITEEEAIEEAKWVVDIIDQYSITYPVAYNCEGYEREENRQFGLSIAERSNLAKVFLDTVYEAGYTPMFYASKSELEQNAKWDTASLEKTYKMWISWYAQQMYPEILKPTYDGSFAMWQYTNVGVVDGIDKPVDMNVSYFGYDSVAMPHNTTPPEPASADVEALTVFSESDESVTAKDVTNLRNMPNKGANSQILFTLKNGEVAHRTGVSDDGWSRLEYGGQICYAVSSLLTTDLEVQAPEQPAEPVNDNGIKTVFTACNETVTPKEEVNLRSLPSVTNPDSVVVVKLPYGATVTRTGINTDYGWSRVDYNGQTLYCISSLVFVVE